MSTKKQSNKVEFDLYHLVLFKCANKLTMPEIALLGDTFRRKCLIVASYEDAATLGTIAKCRSKLYSPILNGSKPEPRIVYWHRLTKHGEKVFNKMKEYFIIPETFEEKCKLAEFCLELQNLIHVK